MEQKNNENIKMKFAELVEKYKSTSMTLFFFLALSGDYDEVALVDIETSQLKEFDADSLFLCAKSRELCAEAFETIKASINNGKATTNQMVSDIKILYKSRMSEVIQPPMSVAEIVAARDREVQNVLGNKASPDHIDAFKKNYGRRSRLSSEGNQRVMSSCCCILLLASFVHL
jgi:hypothetical protein